MKKPKPFGSATQVNRENDGGEGTGKKAARPSFSRPSPIIFSFYVLLDQTKELCKFSNCGIDVK